MIGSKFGRLEVVSRAGTNKHRKITWNCVCECGNKTVAVSGSLRSGNTKSCGCLQKEAAANNARNGALFTTAPGLWRHNLHATWYSMMERCYVREDPAYHNYGGRGIKVCDRWHDFGNFISDVGDRPDRSTLDRVDNDGDYGPENFRWATLEQQGRNKRNNRVLEYNGCKKCLSEWAEYLNIPYSTLSARVNSLGWDVERALSTPLMSTNRVR